MNTINFCAGIKNPEDVQLWLQLESGRMIFGFCRSIYLLAQCGDLVKLKVLKFVKSIKSGDIFTLWAILGARQRGEERSIRRNRAVVTDQAEPRRLHHCQSAGRRSRRETGPHRALRRTGHHGQISRTVHPLCTALQRPGSYS